MRRREFIAGLGGVAAWPFSALAQQGGPLRRVGVLMAGAAGEEQAQSRLAAFQQGLAELGWTDGRNIRVENRWGAGGIDHLRTVATELVDLRPDVLLASTTPALAALRQATRAIPVVFVMASDPVGGGFVASLARPGGNLTGFVNLESSIAGRMLELLIEIAPSVKRVAFIFSPDNSPQRGLYFKTPLEAAAQSLKVEPVAAPVRSDAEIEIAISAFGRAPGGGLVLSPDAFMFVHRATVILAAAQHNIPAVYNQIVYAKDGGLLTYGPDKQDIFRRSASYVDRLLKGSKPADLPVQLPIKFQMALNAKTAKALGLAVPQSILLSADEVIE
jgi:putative tryptophan/tyrosine transport system substrate-binding protein